MDINIITNPIFAYQTRLQYIELKLKSTLARALFQIVNYAMRGFMTWEVVKTIPYYAASRHGTHINKMNFLFYK